MVSNANLPVDFFLRAVRRKVKQQKRLVDHVGKKGVTGKVKYCKEKFSIFFRYGKQ